MAETIHDRLRQAAGKSKRLRFDEYQRIALYDPEFGFFQRSARRAGREGDFLTSPEVAPLFAEVLARALARDAAALDASEFHVLEVGAGRGTLARDLWQALRLTPLGRRIHFHLVEIGTAARSEQAATLREVSRERWTSYANVDELPARPWPAGCLVANELFDNLPVRRVMQTNALQEILVRVGPQKLREEIVPAPVELGAYLEAQGVHLNVGQSAEICTEAPQLLAQLLGHFARASVILIDYGDEAKTLYRPERFPHGTLTAYRGHSSHTDYYADPGENDLTSHVNFTPLLGALEAAGLERRFVGSQMKFLVENGLPEVLERRLASTQDEFERLRIAAWAKQLYHPETMGEAFLVVQASSP